MYNEKVYAIAWGRLLGMSDERIIEFSENSNPSLDIDQNYIDNYHKYWGAYTAVYDAIIHYSRKFRFLPYKVLKQIFKDFEISKIMYEILLAIHNEGLEVV